MAVLTIDPNNPKTFGSGFELLVTTTTQQNIITNNILTEEVSAVSFTGEIDTFTFQALVVANPTVVEQ